MGNKGGVHFDRYLSQLPILCLVNVFSKKKTSEKYRHVIFLLLEIFYSDAVTQLD